MRVQIEHKVRKRAFEFGAKIPIDSEARARDLAGSFEVEDAKLFSEFPVRFGREIELGGRAPAADFDVALRVVAQGNGGVRDVGNARKDLAQAGVLLLGCFFEFLRFFTQGFGLFNLSRRVLAALFAAGDVLGGAVALSLQGLHLGDGLTALGVDFAEVLQNLGRVHPALAQLFPEQRQVVSHES
jgi:hypothetical protein